MRAQETRYAVAGWGRGALWTDGNLVLAHDFTFGPVSDTALARVTSPPGRALSVAPRSSARLSGLECGSACGTVVAKSAHSALDDDRCLTPPALVERLRAFLAGEAVTFDDVAIDLSWCTPFQRAVAVALRAVPRGEVVSYGELAALAGFAGAQRAVGTFCARNRHAFLLPCHRVVAAGGIGSYGASGVPVKRRLLALEGVRL